jgi:deoxyribodipyrimidine photolyase-related protein
MAPAVDNAGRCRNLVLVLGDQLNRDAAAFDDFDPAQDRVWMAEVAEESTHVWSAKQRIAVFLSGMRHFAEALRSEGLALHYRCIEDPGNLGGLRAELAGTLASLRPEGLVVTEPGDFRTLAMLREVAQDAGLPLAVRDDRHFLCSQPDFRTHARGRKQLRMEYFYREQRRRHRVLMDGNEPCGGQWNYDAENRGSFGREGPGFLPSPPRFEPDAITREVIALVESRFAQHPGSLQEFGWPATREQAVAALESFIADRLPEFGLRQDAMWTGEPYLYHALVSSSLNLKLLDPREVIAAAEAAFRGGKAPLASAEGFIRQILGWREYVRGIYWLEMPGYLERNALDAHEPLPDWYWNGETDMRCQREVIGQTLEHGYAHHIQRLMVTGLYAMLLGVEPREVHAWYLAVYVDAVEWVELPNTLGMSQYGDGGLMGSKPYAATGKYIDKMSNYCKGCRYDPAKRTGDDACPFTTLYWDFLVRHEARFMDHPRMALQVRNVSRISAAERTAIAGRAAAIRAGRVGRDDVGPHDEVALSYPDASASAEQSALSKKDFYD